jgi:hypothetical protein
MECNSCKNEMVKVVTYDSFGQESIHEDCQVCGGAPKKYKWPKWLNSITLALFGKSIR